MDDTLVYLMIKEATEWKEAYIATFLAATHLTIDQVEMVESVYHSGSSTILTYFLRKKQVKYV